MRHSKSFDLFLQGLKPAYICNPVTEEEQYDQLIEKQYAFSPIQIFKENVAIFFLNQSLKQSFQNRIGEVKVNSPKYHQIIGETLGFPPIACSYFAKCLESPELKEEKAFFDYNGLCFIGSINNTFEILSWLWEKSSIPKTALQVEFQKEKFVVTDLNMLTLN